MEIFVKHQLPVDEVKNRLKNLSVELKKQYGDQLKDYTEEWNGDNINIAFKAMGFKISGVVKILSDKVVMEGKVPMMLKAFQGQVEDAIYSTLSKILK